MQSQLSFFVSTHSAVSRGESLPLDTAKPELEVLL